MTSTNNTYTFIETVSQWAGLTEIQLFYTGIIFVAVFTVVVLLLSHRKSRKLAQQQSTQLEKLQKDLMVANSTTIGMGQKLIHLEKQLQADLSQKQTQEHGKPPLDFSDKEEIKSSNIFAKPAERALYSQSTGQQKNDNMSKLSLVNNNSLQHSSLQSDELPSDEAYEKSRQLLSQGVDIPEIVKQSGLSFSEVSLMKKLAR